MKKKKATKKRSIRPVAKKGSRIDAYGNAWEDVSPGTPEDVAAVETELGIMLSSELAELLMTCGGGYPTKNFHSGPDSEVFELGVGYVLPLRDQKKKKGIVAVAQLYRNAQDLSQDLIPFAVDTGNANLICERMPKRDVVYWVHDEPDNRVRLVDRSLANFLSALAECPF